MAKAQLQLNKYYYYYYINGDNTAVNVNFSSTVSSTSICV